MSHFWIEGGAIALVEAFMEETSSYEEYFDACMKKFEITSPRELNPEKRKEYFDYVDANWTGEKESKADSEE